MSSSFTAPQLLRRDVIQVLESRGAIVESGYVVFREVKSTVVSGLAVVDAQLPADPPDEARIALFSYPAEVEELVSHSFREPSEGHWIAR